MKLTPKQRVLKRWPKAYAYKWAGTSPWCIYSGEQANQTLNSSDATARQAWANAAKRPSVRDASRKARP